MKRWFAVCLMLIGLLSMPAMGLAQSPPPITYARYDATIDLRADGTLLVREIQQIRFDGTFQNAFAEIPTEYATAISAIQLYEGEAAYQAGGSEPGQFNTYRDGDLQVVEWGFTPTSPGDVRTFILEYVVEGGLWLYPDAQVIEWRAVPAERSDLWVEQSTVTVTVPAQLTAEQVQYTAYGPAYTADLIPAAATQVVYHATEALPEGVAFQVQVGLPPDTVAASEQPWQAAADRANLAYTIPKLEVDLTLEADGDLWVQEDHHLAVEAGVLDQGYRTIGLRYLDAIDEISLSEGDQAFTESGSPCDYCFQVNRTLRRDGWVTYDPAQPEPVINEGRVGEVTIDWQLPPLVRGETTTITLRYRVVGALQILADEERLSWAAVFPDRPARVEAATVTLHLPEGVDPQNATLTGGAVTTQRDGALLVTAPRAVEPGQSWTIYLSLPPGTIDAQPAAWQSEFEAAVAAAAAAAAQRARLQLGFGVVGILLALAGPLGLYLLWYNYGRDLPIPAIADYLTEPPSELPPAIVAYLLDEEPSTKGALASLFHLATLGLLAVRFDNTIAFKRRYADAISATEPITTAEGQTVRIPAHLATLFNALRDELPLDQEVTLARLHGRFRASLPEVYTQMGTEATRFFDELPADARQRWLGYGRWLTFLGLGATLLLAIWYLGEVGWVALLPALALLLVGAGLMWISRWMPRRTNAGVEEAQRWQAFRTYLRKLKSYGTLEDAQRIIDRYFAYAVALDVEEVVLKQAEAMGGRLPPWTYTPTWEAPRRPYRPTPSTTTNPGPVATSGQPLPTGLPSTSEPPTVPSERPSLSGMSKRMGGALTNASSNLGNLLSQAAPTGGEQTFAGGFGAGSTGNTGPSTMEILGKILSESSSGGGGGGYRSSGSSRSSWGSSSRSSFGSRSSSSSARSSSSRRSGGGGRRGFS